MTACDEVLELRPQARCAITRDGELHVADALHDERLGHVSPSRKALMKRLATGPVSRSGLLGTGDDGDELAELITRLASGGWLSIEVRRQGTPLYTLVPLRPPPGPPPATVPAGMVLSRFALLHRDRDGGGMAVESARSWCSMVVHDPGLLGVLADPSGTAGEEGPVGERLRRDLRWAGFAVAGGEEEHDLRLCQWGAHELWFHDRSRLVRGHPRVPFGDTWWARDRFPALPADHEPFSGRETELCRPDLQALRRGDPPLTAVVEDRRSIRRHDDRHPLTARQLGEFLFRCARDRHTRVADGVDYVSRPYPAGGSAYELEIYPLVRRVTGIEPGLHHYDPRRHRLRLVRPMTRDVRRLLEIGARCARTEQEPQTLLIISARFGRVMWKYQEMAYALILKDAGVLTQTMYLVATAMGLAPSAIGGHGAAEFARATGLDPMVEGSVGEFILGSPAPGQADEPA
ncbi:SagB family peptide dehydrogenase [Nonomuraea sp. NPDC005650]|uniref:SagB/ThcOx family dehydrogenase n=1 Tax=Nonomuraea sp. NPDC005650 TaxID=3157045 RepID=UPI0033B8CD8C